MADIDGPETAVIMCKGPVPMRLARRSLMACGAAPRFRWYECPVHTGGFYSLTTDEAGHDRLALYVRRMMAGADLTQGDEWQMSEYGEQFDPDYIVSMGAWRHEAEAEARASAKQ